MTHSPASSDEPSNSKKLARVWSPYELTQLSRHHIALTSLQPDTEAPVEYLTGHVEFAGQDFVVTKDTLIPRIETEELVEMAWQAILAQPDKNTPVSVLDVGTGCGAIAVCLALRAKQANRKISITATDVSAAAVAVAQENAERLTPTASITFLVSDILDAIPTGNTFSVITANLPYIPQERIPYLDSSVKNFEPTVALDGGSDGLQLVDRLLQTAAPFLEPDGVILLEVDYTHTHDSFRAHFAEWHISATFDSFSRNRFITARKKNVE